MVYVEDAAKSKELIWQQIWSKFRNNSTCILLHLRDVDLRGRGQTEVSMVLLILGAWIISCFYTVFIHWGQGIKPY